MQILPGTIRKLLLFRNLLLALHGHMHLFSFLPPHAQGSTCQVTIFCILGEEPLSPGPAQDLPPPGSSTSSGWLLAMLPAWPFPFLCLFLDLQPPSSLPGLPYMPPFPQLLPSLVLDNHQIYPQERKKRSTPSTVGGHLTYRNSEFGDVIMTPIGDIIMTSHSLTLSWVLAWP